MSLHCFYVKKTICISTAKLIKCPKWLITSFASTLWVEVGSCTHRRAGARPHTILQPLILFLCFLLSLDSFAGAVSALDISKHLTSITPHQVNKYLMVKTFVTVCAWLNRIDYWWLTKIHCIHEQTCACDILKPAHRLCNIWKKYSHKQQSTSQAMSVFHFWWA